MSERELWFVAPGRVELRRATARSPLSGEVRARALVSGISQGTELLLFRGEGPEPFDPSLDAPGAPTYPRRYGYAWVGEIVEAPGGELEPGTRVFALAPHGTARRRPAFASCRATCPASARFWLPTWRPRSTSPGTPGSRSEIAC